METTVSSNLEKIWAGDKQAIRLAMGEMTPQEMRNVLALLSLLRPDRDKMRKLLRHQTLELMSIAEQDWGLADEPSEVKFRKRIKQLEAEIDDLKSRVRGMAHDMLDMAEKRKRGADDDEVRD